MYKCKDWVVVFQNLIRLLRKMKLKHVSAFGLAIVMEITKS